MKLMIVSLEQFGENDLSFKLARSKNEGITFLPLKQQQLGSSRTIKFIEDRENICLTSDQARYIYKKVEKDSIVNVEIIKQ